MSELIKLLEILDIRTINFLTLDFTDNHGNFKRITIDYPPEITKKDKEENKDE